MSAARRRTKKQRDNRDSKGAFTPKSVLSPLPAQPPIPFAPLWLSAAFLLPNLGALVCGFVFDDRVLIVENESLHVHSFHQLLQIWRSGYWPDPHGLELYRPVSETLWAALWAVGGGTHPGLFHAVGLALGLTVVLLAYRWLLCARTPAHTAFIAAFLFALFPIHTDATTSVVGSAELLAAALGLGALILYAHGRPVPALVLFALAVLSKESAAAFAALPVVFPRKGARLRNSVPIAMGAVAIIAGALFVHHALSRSSQIPPLDNPMILLDGGRRVLTALWVQCLYVFKTFLPISLSADYSYKQIRLVMGLQDWRAWMGLALTGGAVLLAWRQPPLRPPLLLYAILFSPTANLLFPIGTIMGERLVYAPSLGLSLFVAVLLVRTRYWKTILLVAALAMGVRTAVRNRDWVSADRFYAKLLETSPNSAKAHYSMGAILASKGDDASAIEAYDQAIAIFPAYAEAYRNRGNSLARLGRREEAMASYRSCLRFNPGDYAAVHNLMQLQSGLAINPPRAHF